MWIRRADGDFRAAQLSIDAPDPPAASICFLAHASVDRLLKAMIVKQGRHPQRTHELPNLLALQAPSIRDDVGVIAACTLLDGLYPKSRYDEEQMPTADEARRAFDAARLVRDRLLPLLTEK